MATKEIDIFVYNFKVPNNYYASDVLKKSLVKQTYYKI